VTPITMMCRLYWIWGEMTLLCCEMRQKLQFSLLHNRRILSAFCALLLCHLTPQLLTDHFTRFHAQSHRIQLPSCRSTQTVRTPRDWRNPIYTPSPHPPSPKATQDASEDLPEVKEEEDSGEEWDYEHTSLAHKALSVVTSSVQRAFFAPNGKPRSFRESHQRPDAQHWYEAALEELAAHERNQTWELVDCPPGVKPIGSRWVFKIKCNENGNIKRYKGQLVARGYTQRHGFDYFETFASVAKTQSHGIVLALAGVLDLHLHFINISHAFLNGDIDADIYMQQPEGFEVGECSKVCKLRKAIYGTMQGACVEGAQFPLIVLLLLLPLFIV
jgi:hypothetical protein